MCILSTYEHKKQFLFSEHMQKAMMFAKYSQMLLANGRKVESPSILLWQSRQYAHFIFKNNFQPSFCTVFIKYAERFLLADRFSINPRWGRKALEVGPL